MKLLRGKHKRAPELNVLAQKCARWAVDNFGRLKNQPEAEEINEHRRPSD
jgi:hypothetical protein